MTDVFSNLPAHIADKMRATVARREAAGTNVHFINERGQLDRYAMADDESAARLRKNLVRHGRRVFADEREALAAEYVAMIGYDPFADDPAISCAEVRSILDDYRRLPEAAEHVAAVHASRAIPGAVQ